MSLAVQSQTWFPTHVQVTVLQAKGLRSKGKAGTNDAYAIIQLGKEKYSTTVAEKSPAPVWKEEASFEVPLLHNNNQERCTVRVIVMHRALVGMDKFLGQLDLNLWELHQTKNRRKVQWYPLKSKPGKKEKERGQIEVEVEFKRNNMTASMFDLSMKEKSRSPFGKLKEKIKGKRSDGLPDTASAIVPSMNQYGDDSDEEMPSQDKKKSKLKNLFSKPGLKKNSMSQSMSVLPTLPPSPSQRTVLRPGDFSSEFNQASGSPVSERRFPQFPTIMTHKRTASADTKQVTSGNKKEGLSFFTGLRSKNDPITHSNLCINGNHVYMEESEPKSDSPKDNSLTNSPQVIRRSPMYASAENLSSKLPKETSTTSSNLPDRGMSSSSSNSSLKSVELAKSESSQAEDFTYKGPQVPSDLPKEPKESKKQENKMSSLLSLVTGRKETPKSPDVQQVSDLPLKKDEPKKNGSQQPTDTRTKKNSPNPFEEDTEEEKKSEPFPLEKNAKTSAVKPRLDVSSEAETKARLSSSLSGTSFLAASFYGGQGSPEADLHDPRNLPQSTYISQSHKGSPPPESPTLSEGNKESSTGEPENLSAPLFWRSGVSSKQSESKEVNVVSPFTEKNKPKKTYVKTLLDQLKGKSSHAENENVVDADLVRGILPVLSETSSFYEEPKTVTEKNSTSGFGGYGRNQEDFTVVSTEVEEKSNDYVKEVPKPTPRVQSAPKKESEDEKPVPPKPAPRAPKMNKTQDSVCDGTTTTQPKESLPSDSAMEKASRVGASRIDSLVHAGHNLTNLKTATPVVEDYSYRLDELPVIPENPEGTSDDEQLDDKKNNLHSSVKTNSDSRMHKEDGHVMRDLSEKTSYNKSKDTADKLTSEKFSHSKVKVEILETAHQTSPETVSSVNFPSSSPSVSIPSDKPSAPRVESTTTPTIDVSDKVEGSGKKKLLRAWVSPSETHPIPTVQSGGTVSSRQRTNPVKPMNTQNKNLSSFPQPIKSNEQALNAYNSKKYDPSDPASAYAELTHDELIQLVLKQRDIIRKKDSQVRELEDYIDNLLVRVMEATPNILRSASKKAGRI
ncbi:rab11 family-interacting protein 1 [Bufo gargarizans]|uniref:rab11 family-interacting protein 1 n=1 Tax=Bufo gargarizans TaxID=30331 RepID=UPI001CF3DD99|nr:rab11 family-interacting protein 1 [Bufo gargarizans]